MMHNIRGFEFINKESVERVIPIVLKYICKQNMLWKIVQNCCYLTAENGKSLSDEYDNIWLESEVFFNLIDADIQMMEFVVFGCSREHQLCKEKPMNYSEYEKSTCNMAIIVCDMCYFEIYAKHKNMQKQIERALKEENIIYNYITDENDGRYIFAV